jgi:hypothetical protein
MDDSAPGAIWGGLNPETRISASLATRDPGQAQEPVVPAIDEGERLVLFLDVSDSSMLAMSIS